MKWWPVFIFFILLSIFRTTFFLHVWFHIKLLQYFLEGNENSLHCLIKVQKEQIPRKLDRDPVILQPVIGNICLSEWGMLSSANADSASIGLTLCTTQGWLLTHHAWCERSAQVVSPSTGGNSNSAERIASASDSGHLQSFHDRNPKILLN